MSDKYVVLSRNTSAPGSEGEFEVRGPLDEDKAEALAIELADHDTTAQVLPLLSE